MSAGEAAMIAEKMGQQQAWFDFVLMLNPIDDNFDKSLSTIFFLSS